MSLMLEETHGEGLEVDPDVMEERKRFHDSLMNPQTLNAMLRVSDTLGGIKAISDRNKVEFL